MLRNILVIALVYLVFAAVPAHSQATRQSVIDGYLNTYLPLLSVPSGWTGGSVSTCTTGEPSTAARAATISAINYFRAFNGLNPVVEDTANHANAQQCALMMSANNSLSHAPSTDWPCYTTAGSTGAANSNIQTGALAAQGVKNFMDDSGPSNIELGHRRWLLAPGQTSVGVGMVDRTPAPPKAFISAQCLWVLNAVSTPTSPAVIAWPSAGYFPYQIEPQGRWSVHFPRALNYDVSAAAVSLTGPTGAVPFTKQISSTTGFGWLTSISFQWTNSVPAPAFGTDASYTVTISGLKIGGAAVANVVYTVILINATSSATTTTGTTTTATGTTTTGTATTGTTTTGTTTTGTTTTGTTTTATGTTTTGTTTTGTTTTGTTTTGTTTTGTTTTTTGTTTTGTTTTATPTPTTTIGTTSTATAGTTTTGTITTGTTTSVPTTPTPVGTPTSTTKKAKKGAFKKVADKKAVLQQNGKRLKARTAPDDSYSMIAGSWAMFGSACCLLLSLLF